jgi:hypothetical protein
MTYDVKDRKFDFVPFKVSKGQRRAQATNSRTVADEWPFLRTAGGVVHFVGSGSFRGEMVFGKVASRVP